MSRHTIITSGGAPALSSRELGELVRNASSNKRNWPKIAVWHGSADHTLSSLNAEKTLQQWVDVHGLSKQPADRDIVDGYPRQAWRDKNGEVVIESYSIIGMAHGTPFGRGENEEHFGLESAFVLEAGISSSYHIAKFFGLTTKIVSPQSATKKQIAAAPKKPRSHLPAGNDVAGVINRALAAAGLLKSPF